MAHTFGAKFVDGSHDFALSGGGEKLNSIMPCGGTICDTRIVFKSAWVIEGGRFTVAAKSVLRSLGKK